LRIKQKSQENTEKKGCQESKRGKNELNSSDVPSAPHIVQHPMDVLSGIGTIYEVK
jgi:hypothetical protein